MTDDKLMPEITMDEAIEYITSVPSPRRNAQKKRFRDWCGDNGS
jgi:hypothetical protein